MKQLFLCHLNTFLCFQSVLRLSCIFLFHLFHLFWRANQFESLKIAGDSRRRQDICGILWGFPIEQNLRGESRPVLPLRDQPALFRPREGRQPLRWRPLLFLLRRFWELTHFVLKYFSTFFRSFSIDVHLTDIEIFSSVFNIW